MALKCFIPIPRKWRDDRIRTGRTSSGIYPFSKCASGSCPPAKKNLYVPSSRLFDITGHLEYEQLLTQSCYQLLSRLRGCLVSRNQLGKRDKRQLKRRAVILTRILPKVSASSELAQYMEPQSLLFLRVFRTEVGTPPYEYLKISAFVAPSTDSKRQALAAVTAEAGFSSQSQRDVRFKRLLSALRQDSTLTKLLCSQTVEVPLCLRLACYLIISYVFISTLPGSQQHPQAPDMFCMVVVKIRR